MPLRNKLATALVSGCLTIAFNCYGAMDSEVSVGTDVRWIDNVFFTESDKLEDTLVTLYADINLASVEEVTEFELGYEISREDYLEDSFDSQNYYQGTGSLNVHLLPTRLFWRTRIGSEVTQRDSIGADIPTNRDQRNYAETGLEYLLMNTGRDQVSILPSVSTIRFREADYNDSDRGGLRVSWNHSMSRLTGAGLNCEGEKVDFKNGEGDYDTLRCNVSLTRNLRRGSVGLDVGKRSINPEIGDKVNGMAYTLGFRWTERQHGFGVFAVRDIVDNTQSFFGQGFEGGGSPIEVNTDFKSIAVRKRYEIQYSYAASRTDRLEASVYRDVDDVYESNLDTDRTGLNLNYTRALTKQMEAKFTYNFLKTEYAQSTNEENVDYDEVYRVELGKLLSRQFKAYGALVADTRRAQIDGLDYEVYSAELGAFYTF